MLVCLQARAKSAHWKEGAQLGEGRWADTTSSLDGTRPNQSHSHFRFSLDWNPDKEKGDLYNPWLQVLHVPNLHVYSTLKHTLRVNVHLSTLLTSTCSPFTKRSPCLIMMLLL